MDPATFAARLAVCCETAREDCRLHANDSGVSTIWASRKEQFESFAERLANGETPEALCAAVREKLPSLWEECDREAEYPSFDWYDEHYHYKVLRGQCEACEALLKLAEEP